MCFIEAEPIAQHFDIVLSQSRAVTQAHWLVFREAYRAMWQCHRTEVAVIDSLEHPAFEQMRIRCHL